MSQKNRLRIVAKGIDFEISGDAETLRRSYTGVRHVLTEKFRETMIERSQPNDETVQLGRDELADLSTSADPSQVRRRQAQINEDEKFINVITCHPVYKKMYLISEARLADSFLGRTLEAARIGKVYVDSGVEPDLKAQLPLGDALWRELTDEGKAAIGRGESG